VLADGTYSIGCPIAGTFRANVVLLVGAAEVAAVMTAEEAETTHFEFIFLFFDRVQVYLFVGVLNCGQFGWGFDRSNELIWVL
jgi:hypothetical protein